MKVTLNITEDTELRAAMKEAISQQVKAVVRDELQNLVQEELRRKVSISASLANPHVIRELTSEEIRHRLHELLPGGALTRDELRPLVENAVEAWLTKLDFTKLVSEVANIKINKLIAQ